MQLTKHHGLGNDFLVLIDLDDAHPIDAGLAIAVCDRHRGVGADGLIRVTRGEDTPFAMELRNEDGTRAEMSGNGISCMAQAIVRAGLATHGRVAVTTDAGLRVVSVVGGDGPTRHRMRVAMGSPAITGALPEWTEPPILRSSAVDVGNPHVVCHVGDPADLPDLESFGRKVSESTPGGANVELVTVGDPGQLHMWVYERGVGPTQACGTGAVATAVAAHSWELCGSTVTVQQPGGPAVVELEPDQAYLTVEVVAIASLDWLT